MAACALIFLRNYPAVRLFFFTLTLLCAYFSLRLLPCFALIFLRTYPAYEESFQIFGVGLCAQN